MTRFHCSGLLYRPNDIIQPGNFGKVIEGAGASHSLVWREIAFEVAREVFAPNSASRLRSVFLLPTEEDARAYATREANRVMHIYEVRLMEENALEHRGDLNAFSAFSGQWGTDAWREIIRKYWLGDCLADAPHWEMLTESPVAVVSYRGCA